MNLTRTSKYVSLLLRHKPEKAGIHLDQYGWAEVDELIKGVSKTHMFNMEILEEIVRTDNKQRYSFNEDKTKIRANQGHSIPVDVELKEAKPPKQLWHGTGEKYVSAIDEQGLLHKNRLYVHLSTNEETAIKVGKRHGKPVLYTVNAEGMYQDGYKFFLSKNGVWLTDHVPEVWGSVYDVRNLLDASVRLMDGESLLDMDLPMPIEKLKGWLLKFVKDTDIEKLLEEYELIKK